jgi:hypothetical protein
VREGTEGGPANLHPRFKSGRRLQSFSRVPPSNVNTDVNTPAPDGQSTPRAAAGVNLAAMTWIHRVSHRPLSDYVEYLWIVDGYFQPRAQELVLPTAA